MWLARSSRDLQEQKMAADPASLVAGGIATGAAAVMLAIGVEPAVLAWVVLGSMAGMAATGYETCRISGHLSLPSVA